MDKMYFSIHWTKWEVKVKLTHKILSSEPWYILNNANSSLESFALHAAPVL